MKCYNILLTSKGLLFYKRSFSVLTIILLNIILLILFILKGYNYFCHYIYKIYKGINSYKNEEIINNNNIVLATGNSTKN